MTTKYTIRITELLGTGPQPQQSVFVAAESIEDAVRKAGDRYACHTAAGVDYEVHVFIGADGWYQASECVWRGRVVFSQVAADDFRMLEASGDPVT